MNKTIEIKGVMIGEGAPKICVSMIGRTLQELRDEATELQNLDVDIVEWRVDFFANVENLDCVNEALQEIRKILHNKPLVFTFRSAKEGGEKEVSSAFYFELKKMVAESGLVDLIDVELFNEEQEIREIIELAQEKKMYVILSNHDFEKTPAKEEIVSRLKRAQKLGADIPKIAVMPQTTSDVLTLLDATLTMSEQFADRPIITMSMAGKGVISRLAGEVFGSSVTFGAVKKASAPGQVEIAKLRQTLTLLNQSL
ncbi:type I 3-dehydroquinate dehydratase [Litchfieldia salsa]|uniref:3-dehydroquinate dehydratase n=1 Tax=Litchfieldia salsa TaxID=930152 RepID=A0A1H0W9D2_9BACI|nr:type I 3-dehydroquinate dehydratase [Litchfieldia salsa]SDP87369.1 3-dehydroquinate dehydratase [Litchfieldia salsa]